MALTITRNGSSDGTISIVRVLEEEIALGQLRPRERLVEDELIVRFGAKRHVIRQALLDLEAMGVVIRQPNKGATVRDFTADEVEQLYAVRELLEREAAELIPVPGTPSLVATLRSVHGRHSEASSRHDLRTVFRQNLLFHRTLFAACGNPALTEAIEYFAGRTHGIRSYAIRDASLLQAVIAQHESIICALEDGDRQELVALVVDHIQPAKAAYLRLAAMSPLPPIRPQQEAAKAEPMPTES